MQAGEVNSRAATVPSAWPSLPFALSLADVPADPLPPALVTRLDALQQLAVETRNQIDLLRRESARVARVITSSWPPAPHSKQSLAYTPAASPGKDGAPDAEEARLTIFLLGTFEAGAKGKVVIHWPSRKSRLLLAYLALEQNRFVPKDVLIELFWPEFPPSRGSNNLSIAVHQVRSTLKKLAPGGDHILRVEQGLYGLEPTLVGWVDLHEFQRLLSEARLALRCQDRDVARERFLAAVNLYRGDFLESDLYEEWTAEPRRTTSAALARALAWLASDAAQRKDWERVLDHAGEIVRREPCDEEGHRLLITAYWQLGKRAHALRQCQACSERLLEDLGAEPSEETQSLFLKVKSGE